MSLITCGSTRKFCPKRLRAICAFILDFRLLALGHCNGLLDGDKQAARVSLASTREFERRSVID